RIGFLDLQWLNLVSNMLNYAPLRLGAIARGLYHLRVDRLTIVQLAAWMAVIAYLVVLAIGACVLATLARSQLDWIWVLLLLGQMVLGAAAARVVVSYSLVHRYLQGVDRIVIDRASLWGALLLRLVDLAAYTTRFAVAMHILGVSLPSGTDIVVLAVVALAASLIPFGRLGFREACVALTAARLNMDDTNLEATWAQLALVESMGEMLVFLPCGGIALIWFRKRWKGAVPETSLPK
ncbi:MAG: hypothetical protein ACYTGC_16700, partial [Planctomycetota bacterium]